MKAFLYIYLLISVVFVGFSQQSGVLHFTEDDELPSNHVTGVSQDERGFIWAETTQGFAQFNGYDWTPISSEVANFTPPFFTEQRIDTTQFSTTIREKLGQNVPTTYFKDDQGGTWIGTEKQGLLYVADLQKEERATVVFEFIGFNNKIVRTVEEEVTVDYSFQTLSIAYTTLNFAENRRTKYRYKIDGIHSDWVITKDPKVQFTSLPDRGTYEFTIQAQKNNGSWGPEAALQLHFLTPFYKTYAFIGAIIALGLLALFLGIRWFFRRKLKVQQLESQLTQLEGKALQSQMNPHFVFNALNSIQSFIATGQTMRSEVYLSKFSNLLRKTLQNSRSNAISLSQEIENATTYLELEKMRFEERLQYRFDIEESLEQDLLKVPPMLLQPFIENAIIHGLSPKKKGGHIEIKVSSLHTNALKYTVIDDGVGRQGNPNNDHVSLGTDIVRQRLSLHTHSVAQPLIYTDLTDNAGNAVGTQVELIVPII